MENANGDDWQEEVFQKIRSMKEIYLPHVNDIYQRVSHKLHHEESLPNQQRPEMVIEKIKRVNANVERMIQFLCIPKSSIMPVLKDKLAYNEKNIIGFLQSHTRYVSTMQQKMSSSTPASTLELGQGSSLNNADGSDWQEEVFQKIKPMKEMYLPVLAEIRQRVVVKLHQHECLVLQRRSEMFKELGPLKTKLDRMIQFLSMPKSDIMPAFKDKVDYYENQIISFLNMHRVRVPPHQGQRAPSHTNPRSVS